MGPYLERSEDVDEVEGRATTFSTEGTAFVVVAAFSVYLDKRDIGISDRFTDLPFLKSDPPDTHIEINHLLTRIHIFASYKLVIFSAGQ